MKMMILDTLQTQKEEMRRLQARESYKKNKSQQEKTDGKYRVLLMQAHRMVETIQYLNAHTRFVLSDAVKTDLIALFSLLQSAVSTGLADSVKVEKGEQDMRKLQVAVKKEWSAFYSAFTRDTVNTLKVISGIDKETTTECLRRIQAASEWEADKSVYEQMVSSIEDANVLISNLKMDQLVIDFLRKMNVGHATLADLTPNVSEWIQKESIESKIRLSFVIK